MTYWFLSDLHLKTQNEVNSQRLIQFFNHLDFSNGQKHQVLFLGDIFDIWIGPGSVFQKDFNLILKCIKNFTEQGGELIYLEGNHDFHIHQFWQNEMKAKVYKDDYDFRIDHLSVRCEHGDFINLDDNKYLNYRKKMRTPFVKILAHVLPSYFIKWIGHKLSSKSRKKTSEFYIHQQDKIKAMLQVFAQRIWTLQKYDLVVTGHMHVFDDRIISAPNQRDLRSINLGTWLEKPRILKIEKLYKLNKNTINIELVEFN